MRRPSPTPRPRPRPASCTLDTKIKTTACPAHPPPAPETARLPRTLQKPLVSRSPPTRAPLPPQERLPRLPPPRAHDGLSSHRRTAVGPGRICRSRRLPPSGSRAPARPPCRHRRWPLRNAPLSVSPSGRRARRRPRTRADAVSFQPQCTQAPPDLAADAVSLRLWDTQPPPGLAAPESRLPGFAATVAPWRTT